MQWLAPHLHKLLAIAAATIDENGRLIEANRGFLRLIETDNPLPAETQVAQFFIQPSFATLLNTAPDAAGEIHNGLLTIGDYMGQTRSLRAQIWRQDQQLRLLAEFDIAEIERICATTQALNLDYANTQLELAQSNLKLKQNEAQLQQLVSELTAANTQRQLAQDQLLQAEKLASIGFLAAGVAHEINNPLGFVSANFNVVGQYLEALLRIVDAYAQAGQDPEKLAAAAQLQDELEVDFIKEDADLLLRESRTGLDRVKRIVLALKEFSGVDAIRTWSTADLKQSIENTISLLANELHQCEVRNELPDLPHIECVPAEINQVFMNLLLNAAQAMLTPGSVRINGGIENDEVWISISDTGKGIPPENLPRIFDPFFTTKPVGQGTGLGLSRVHGIIGLHQGRIEVSSQAGQGTIFTVHLPICQKTR